MDETEIAGDLIAGLAAALESLTLEDPGARDFAARLAAELRAAELARNPQSPEGPVPPAGLRRLVETVEPGPCAAPRAALRRLSPILTWIRADHFYPDPEHRAFSLKMWGAMIVGEEDALFTAEARYIALLMLIEPETLYPLHAHRIEELYLVLAGQADWSHDGEDWTTLTPGTAFHNRSYQPHAIRTGRDPVVAMGLYLPPFGWENALVAQGAEGNGGAAP